MTAIENENRKPSYHILSRLLKTLGLSADQIFYPETNTKYNPLDQTMRMLHLCSENELAIIRTLINALIDNRNTEK